MGVSSKTNVNFGGYGAAQEVDDLINRLLEKHDITPENTLEWRIFTRTIGTSLHLIDEKITQICNASKPRRRWDD